MQAIITESVSSTTVPEQHRLEDLLGDGATVEAADLVVTPERVESAIHNLSDDAITDVQEALGVGSGTFVGLTDTPATIGSNGQVLGIVSNALAFVDQGSGLEDIGYTWTEDADTPTTGETTLTLTDSDNHNVMEFIKRSDDTYDLRITGQLLSGGGITP